VIAALASVLLLAEAAAGAAPAPDAEALFREGLKAYDAKQYARAIESFEAAHKLSPLPEILFDIAMARRALGDCPRAAASFDAFIDAAPADDPLLARARIRRAELDACAKGDGGGAAAQAVAGAAPPPLPAPNRSSPAAPALLIGSAPAPSPRPERLWLRNTCYASVGSTAVLGIGGLVFAWQARSAQQDAEAFASWNEDAVRVDERGQTFALVASTLLISAGVTTAIAVASCVAMSRSGNDR
jgi:tetratricopeptide (TPR) repeat protein